MQQQQHQRHTKDTLYYSISRMLERASYYGLRGILILYMIGATMQMDKVEVGIIYGWFTSALIITPIIGGLLGDLLLGNKKTILIGGVMQALGAFTLCIPSTTALFIGLILTLLGSGLYIPNFTSNFGKLYWNKTKLLDSGFTILYFAINLGSFFGVLLIAYIAETYGYPIGFAIVGLLMLLSLIPILVSKETKLEVVKKSSKETDRSIANIVIALITVGLFWGLYEISNIRTFELQTQLSVLSNNFIPVNWWQPISILILIPISVIAAVAWTYIYNSPFFKLMVGFLFGALSFGLLLLIPEVPSEQDITVYIVSVVLLVIAEIHIAPIIHSVLTKYAPPKYLAIFMSVALLPTKIVSIVIGWYQIQLDAQPILALKVSIIVLALVGLGLMSYVVWNKKQQESL